MSRNVCALSALVAVLSSGCLMAGNYHSARTLAKGTSASGLNFAATTYEKQNDDGTTDRITLPTLIPEFTYHIGVTDDVEVGGRVSIGSLGLEGDVKWRFLHEGGLHLAIAPALGYQALVVVQGLSLRLPGILTYELTDNFAINLALFAGYTDYSEVDTDSSDDASGYLGRWATTGGAVGVELRGATFVVRPSIEVARYAYDFEDTQQDAFTTTSIIVHVGWIGGQEKQQLDRIEQRQIYQQPGYPPPAPAPPPAPMPDSPSRGARP